MDNVQLVGIGIGPFNLSLAALSEKARGLKTLFFDQKAQFDWHSEEIMLPDSTMQTSYLKDLVTPVDPTSSHSFLNYLVENHLFYPFLNTRRSTITRKEFEQYCRWVSGRLKDRLNFQTEVRGVDFKNDAFEVETSRGMFKSRHVCVATGLTPKVPECAQPFLGRRVFHAKSGHMKHLQLEGKSVLIVGGGQTGIEIFRNAFQNRWGRVKDLTLISQRKTLEPLDESAFTNDYFTPNYVDAFWNLDSKRKEDIVEDQKLASDGNTPAYLSQLYEDLYQLKYVEKDPRPLRILACRELTGMREENGRYAMAMKNAFLNQDEAITAEVVILCTGFSSAVPRVLEPLCSRIAFDENRRFQFKKSYAIEWDGPKENRIYALNFSRHAHGIVDPQTSLMAWRSAMVINDVMEKQIYNTSQAFENFVEYGSSNPEEHSSGLFSGVSL